MFMMVLSIDVVVMYLCRVALIVHGVPPYVRWWALNTVLMVKCYV